MQASKKYIMEDIYLAVISGLLPNIRQQPKHVYPEKKKSRCVFVPDTISDPSTLITQLPSTQWVIYLHRKARWQKYNHVCSHFGIYHIAAGCVGVETSSVALCGHTDRMKCIRHMLAGSCF